ncbi:MAG TPA: F0F1 ATP synthase subunit delta [Blastocatellia bacterium]|nr:F0F1 ATP synthase subunit delta [Blastocatellia bacterium]
MKTTKQVKREARALFRLCLVGGLLDEGRVEQVVRAVLRSKLRRSLALATHLERLVRLDIAQHTAKVESVTPLEAELQTRVQTGLVRLYGSGVSVSFAENPELIAGMRIKVGSDVYDQSVKAKLGALEKGF